MMGVWVSSLTQHYQTIFCVTVNSFILKIFPKKIISKYKKSEYYKGFVDDICAPFEKRDRLKQFAVYKSSRSQMIF